ncbi:hypothetical protein XBKB1_620005 [Xenorhabdus bovienii str. kraussei Becker Underwood]|uniref:Uncharacterized protein n=1 Tax=Xenorhabdus bovienii str. kraussei Becker Underwood TaxID=1398204 RepID=A0A077Q2W2_XENBV|nr:hypothetical protein XBKB1_620005 [Xenorhabdus bovienii str. kraussei Becker Underwood]
MAYFTEFEINLINEMRFFCDLRQILLLGLAEVFEQEVVKELDVKFGRKFYKSTDQS